MADFNRNTKITRYVHGHVSGGVKSPTYHSWQGMRKRCLNKKSNDYHLYGGRGITVCERWKKFANFLADMGERPAGMTIDRWPNPSGNYEPTNCRWATPTEQSRNTSVSLYLTARGKTQHVEAWAAETGIYAAKIRQRMWRGQTPEDCLSVEKLVYKVRGGNCHVQGRFGAGNATRPTHVVKRIRPSRAKPTR